MLTDLLNILLEAEEEKRKYEEHRAANRPRYSIIATLGGGNVDYVTVFSATLLILTLSEVA